MNFRKLVNLYARYITGKGELTVIAIISLFLWYIPAYYTITTKIPPENQLKNTEGVLFFKTLPGKGYLIGLHTQEGDVLFTGKDPIIRNHRHRLSEETKGKIEGSQAIVAWYRQQTYLWSYQNRLVELRVGNNKLIGIENTNDSIEFSKKLTIVGSIILPLFMVGLNAMSRLIFRKTVTFSKPDGKE